MIIDAAIPTSCACAALGLNRGGYYAWRNATPAQDRSGELRNMVHTVALKFPGYGYRRITAELHRRQIITNHKRVLRLMRAGHLLCKRKSYKPRTTSSNHDVPLYQNLIKDIVITHPNQLWVADIMYVIANLCCKLT